MYKGIKICVSFFFIWYFLQFEQNGDLHSLQNNKKISLWFTGLLYLLHSHFSIENFLLYCKKFFNVIVLLYPALHSYLIYPKPSLEWINVIDGILMHWGHLIILVSGEGFCFFGDLIVI